MENYMKGTVQEVEEVPPFSSLHDNVVEMRVQAGSKIRNIMGYAIKKMKEPDVKQITWNGSGLAVTKTITCAEIMKRKFKNLHQITKIRFRRIEEYWEPKLEGLERLKVNRDIPAISILLSKEPLDKTEEGYQAPGSRDPAWVDRAPETGRQRPRDREGGAGSDNPRQKRKRRKDKVNTSTKTGRHIDNVNTAGTPVNTSATTVNTSATPMKTSATTVNTSATTVNTSTVEGS